MIKRFRASILVASVLAGAGCVPSHPLVVDQPIGPLNPAAPPPNYGTLLVYSDTESFDGDPDYLIHTGYTVLTPEGTLVQKVDNGESGGIREPQNVSLPAGRYRVVARAAYYGSVTLSAVIEAGRKTVIDLNEEVLPQRTSESAKWVRLPDGQIVGLKAD